MKKGKIFFTIITISVIINIIFSIGLYYLLTKNVYILGDDMSIGTGSVVNLSNQKIITKNLEEYREISDLQNNITDTITQVAPGVVSIVITRDLKVFEQDPQNFFGGRITEQEQKIGGGSGIIVSSDGYIVTNKHVVQDPTLDYTVVSYEGDKYDVSKIWLDPVLDIAVLQIIDSQGNPPSNLSPAKTIAFDSKIKIGQFVLAIGNALAEFDNTITLGILSAKDRQLQSQQVRGSTSLYLGLYQTDAPINPGNSGGPLIDMNGSVIGINTAIALGEGIGFAIPVNDKFIQSTIDIIKKNGKIIRPFVGIEYIDLDKAIAKSLDLDKFKGVYVSEVLANSPAAKAGIQANDIILEIEGQEINKDYNFLYQLYTYQPGDDIELMIYSDEDSEYKKITITLGELK